MTTLTLTCPQKLYDNAWKATPSGKSSDLLDFHAKLTREGQFCAEFNTKMLKCQLAQQG
jgi:hypothetical protein